MVDKETIPEFKRIINKDIDEKTLQKMNKDAKKFETYVKLVSGSKYRGERILTSKDKGIFTSVLEHLVDLQKNGLFETKYDAEKLLEDFKKNGRITKEHEGLIKDYQKEYINRFLKENEEGIDITSSNQEKNFTKKVIENLNWKKGKEIKRTLINEKLNEKYEFEISEKGIGYINFYSKINDKYVITKNVAFDINEDRFNTQLYRILEDGKMGIETFRGIIHINKKVQAANVQQPKQKVMIGFSMNGYYITKDTHPIHKLFSNETRRFDEPMKDLSYEIQRQIMYGKSKIYMQPDEMVHKYYNQSIPFLSLVGIKPVIKSYEKEMEQYKGEELKEKTKDEKKEKTKDEKKEINFFVYGEIDPNTKNFEIDLNSLIDRDFDEMIRISRERGNKTSDRHIELIENYRKQIKERIESIKKESGTVGEFMNKINRDDIVSLYPSLMKRFLNMPNENNYYNMRELTIASGNKDKLSFIGYEIIKRALDALEKEKPGTYKEIIDGYFDNDRNKTAVVLDLVRLSKNTNLYESFMYHFMKEDLKSLQKVIYNNFNRGNLIPEEYVKSEMVEEDKKQNTLKSIVRTSPNEEEVKNLKTKIMGNSLWKNIYQTYYEKEKGSKVDISKTFSVEDPIMCEFWKMSENPKGSEIERDAKEYVYKKELESFKEFVIKTSEMMSKKQEIKTLDDFKKAWEIYGISYMDRDKNKLSRDEIERTIKKIESDPLWTGAYQFFHNKMNKNKLKWDNIIGNRTRATYEENGNPSKTLIEFTKAMNDPNQQRRLLFLSKQNRDTKIGVNPTELERISNK